MGILYLGIHPGDFFFEITDLAFYLAELVGELLAFFLFFIGKDFFLLYYNFFFNFFTFFYFAEGRYCSLF